MNDQVKITIFVYAFNHEAFIADAINGALNQTFPPMEIIISDDCSTDSTFVIMKEIHDSYRGPHKLILNRNETNLGITAHLNKIIELGSGDWFVLCAGDDISLPNRVSTILQTIHNRPDIYSLGTGLLLINERGETTGYQGFHKEKPYITGASSAWRKECFETFGPISQHSTAEDVIIPFRALLLGRLALIDEPTVKYRLHDDNYSSPIVTDRLAALKHLRRIKGTLIAACKQRLIDMERVKDRIVPSVYQGIQEEHKKIMKDLEIVKLNIQQTILLWESNIGKRLVYLAGIQTYNGKHTDLIYRIKQFLLSFPFLRSSYFLIQRQLRRHRVSAIDKPTGQVRIIELADLLNPEIGPLILL